MPGFVKCPACGTRIRSDRQQCLRCEALLRPADPPPHVDAPWRWLAGISSGQLYIVGVVASVALLLTIVVTWESRLGPADAARPALSVADPVSRPVPPVVPAAVGSTGDVESLATTFFDSSRRAAAAYSTGDFNQARQVYEQALEKKPDNPDSLNNLAQVLVRLGQTADAIPPLERAIALAPRKWAYHFNLARAVGQLGDWDRAVGEYRIAAELFPTDYATQYNLAMALHKKGDEEAAVPEFQKAIALAPDEPIFHLSLGISLEKLGKVVDARREYAAYLELAPSAPEAETLKAHIRTLGEPAPAPVAPKPTTVS